jgi:hypothetical protein
MMMMQVREMGCIGYTQTLLSKCESHVVQDGAWCMVSNANNNIQHTTSNVERRTIHTYVHWYDLCRYVS